MIYMMVYLYHVFKPAKEVFSGYLRLAMFLAMFSREIQIFADLTPTCDSSKFLKLEVLGHSLKGSSHRPIGECHGRF